MEENLCMQWVALSANRREVYIATNYYPARNIINNGCFEKCSTQYRFIIPSCKIKKRERNELKCLSFKKSEDRVEQVNLDLPHYKQLLL